MVLSYFFIELLLGFHVPGYVVGWRIRIKSVLEGNETVKCISDPEL